MAAFAIFVIPKAWERSRFDIRCLSKSETKTGARIDVFPSASKRLFIRQVLGLR